MITPSVHDMIEAPSDRSDGMNRFGVDPGAENAAPTASFAFLRLKSLSCIP